jgi:hypothetical protein
MRRRQVGIGLLMRRSPFLGAAITCVTGDHAYGVACSMSAVPRQRSNVAAQQNFAMGEFRT